MKFLKLTILTLLFLVLVPIKWVMVPIIKVCSFIEIQIANYTLYFLNNLN
jgi:hypothetical protein